MAKSNFRPGKYARDLCIIFSEVHFNRNEESDGHHVKR